MALKSPSEIFKRNKVSAASISADVAPQVTESYIKFVDNFETVKEISEKTKVFEKVDELSKKVEEIKVELAEKLTRSDLENAMLSHLMVLDENFKELQNQVKGLNRRDLKEFKDTAHSLNELIENLIEIELPIYKNKVTKSEIFVGEQVSQLRETVDESINDVKDEIDSKIVEFVDVLEQNFESIQQQIQESSDQVQKTTQVYGNLSKILESKIEKENEKFEEYSNLIESVSNSFEELSRVLKDEIEEISKYTEEQFQLHQKEVKNIQEQFESSIDVRINDYRKELVDVKTEVVINEQHIKNVDKYLQEYHQDLVQVKEEVFSEIESLPIGNLQENIERLEKKIDFIKETYSQIEPEVIIKEVIQESNFTEPPETKNNDPLTPLNQNFVTLEQLQQHYRLFLNRIQQQISTLGGGGETRLKYLDDVVGIATNPSAYDGKYLKYNHSIGKFQFSDINSDDDSWVDNSYGTYTNANVGIGTSIPQYDLDVNGDINFNGSFYQNGSPFVASRWTAGIGNDIYRLNGDVGIGTTTPTSKLQVIGDANISGIITATTYYGDGSNLSNIISGVAVRKNNVVVGTGATTFNFTGAGVSSITVSSGIATINIPAPQKTTVYYTATEGQTTFTANYTVGYIDVYLNGVKLSQAEFTANNGTSVILSTGVSSGDIVELTGYTTFNVASSYASNAGVATYALVAGYASNSGFSTNSQLADVATVANTLIPNANVNTTGVITATAFVGNGSNLSGIVTNITAGDNITVSSSSGNITISASGGGGNWVSSGTTKVYTTSSVGIGILNPTYNLDVFGNINFTGTLFQNGTPFSGSKWLGDAAPTATIYRLSNVGVGLTNPIARLGASSFTLGNVGHSTSGIVTTTSSSTNQVLDSMPTATFRSARYQVSIACTGQLVGSATSSSTSSIGAITPGTFYIPGTYTNVPLISTSGSDALANITVVGTTNNVGYTTTGNLLVVNTLPSGIGTNQPIILASNVPNDTLTGTALTAGTIYYATGIGTTAFTVSYTSGGAAVAIGTTSFAGVGNTVTISGGVSIVSITSPGSGYGIGVTLTAATSNLGTVGSGFTCAIGNVVSNYQTSDLMILQSVGSASTSCDYIEYASLANNEILGTFNSDISGTNARLLFSPTYRNNTINLVRHSIVV